MAKKQQKKPAPPPSTPAKAAAPAPPAKNYTDGPTEGKTFPIKVWREGDVYEDYFHGAAKDREVFISGAAYDHVDTTADGVWIYRNDRKN